MALENPMGKAETSGNHQQRRHAANRHRRVDPAIERGENRRMTSRQREQIKIRELGMPRSGEGRNSRGVAQ